MVVVDVGHCAAFLADAIFFADQIDRDRVDVADLRITEKVLFEQRLFATLPAMVEIDFYQFV